MDKALSRPGPHNYCGISTKESIDSETLLMRNQGNVYLIMGLLSSVFGGILSKPLLNLIVNFCTANNLGGWEMAALSDLVFALCVIVLYLVFNGLYKLVINKRK